MTELNLNRERRKLLAAVGAGHVYRSEDGTRIFRQIGRNKTRIDAKVRQLQEAGLVDDALQLTDAGRTAMNA